MKQLRIGVNTMRVTADHGGREKGFVHPGGAMLF